MSVKQKLFRLTLISLSMVIILGVLVLSMVDVSPPKEQINKTVDSKALEQN